MSNQLPDLDNPEFKSAGRDPFFPYDAFDGEVELCGLRFSDGKDPKTGLQQGEPAFFAKVRVLTSNRDDVVVGMTYAKYFPYTQNLKESYKVQKFNRLLAAVVGLDVLDPRFSANKVAQACIAETVEETLSVKLHLTSVEGVSKKTQKKFTEDSWRKI